MERERERDSKTWEFNQIKHRANDDWEKNLAEKVMGWGQSEVICRRRRRRWTKFIVSIFLLPCLSITRVLFFIIPLKKNLKKIKEIKDFSIKISY